MRFIGMDVHRDFCEIAIVEPDGRVCSAGRIDSTVEELDLFAGSLAIDDVVALEATSGAGLIAEIIEPHVAGVLVANTRKLPQISKAKAKTDRLDARTLARLARRGSSRRWGRRMSGHGRFGGCAPDARRSSRPARAQRTRRACGPSAQPLRPAAATGA